MISTGELTAPGALSAVKLTKLGAAESAGEGNDVDCSKSHSVMTRSNDRLNQ